jgi:carboxymethylenebutenolidase
MPTNHVTLKVSDGTSMQVYISLPEGKEPFPGIILFQEAFGVNGHIRNVADRIAKEGYTVIAPELFHRTAKPGEEFAYGDFAPIAPHFQAITTDGLAADSKACYDWLQQQSNVQHSKIGCIGFCLGGRVSFIANATLPLSAAVSFYGGSTDALTNMAKDLHAPHLFFWGGLDKHITSDKVDTVINAVKAANKEYINVVISYADHAFACDARPSYNQQASDEAWAMTRAFFKNKLY